ncbi:MAG: hypothetical protein ACOX5W_02300 [Bacillota bacterium]|jgi:hypothetical protein
MLKDILENAQTRLETTHTAQTRVRDNDLFVKNLDKVLVAANSLELYLNTAAAAEANRLMNVSLDAIIRNDIITTLQMVLSQIYEGYLETASVSSVSKNVANFKKHLDSLWVSSQKSATEQVVSLLKTFKQFMPNEYEANNIINNLEKALTGLPASVNNVNAFSANLQKARQMVEQIGADEETQAFIQKVLDKQATLADITPNVLAWIYKHDITRRLKISLV